MGEPLLLRIPDVLTLLNISRRYLQNLRLRGQFPPATRKLGRTPVWHRETIEAWARGEWAPAPRSARRKAMAAGSK